MKVIFKKIIVAILTLEAKLVLAKYKPKIIAVTGNVGKTSTKDAIYTTLSPKQHVRKSDKSFNSEIGVPLTILGRPNAWSNPIAWLTNITEGILLILLPHEYPKWLILEVGADRPGDISSAARWLKPDIAVITRLPELPVHVEYFPSAEAVRKEKLSLLTYVKKDGVIVVNADDQYIMRALAGRTETTRCITFGIKSEANVHGSAVEIVYQGHAAHGVQAQIRIGEKEYSLSMPGSAGRQQVYAALGALAVGEAVGASAQEGIDALAKHASPPGRMRLIEGKGDVTIIDDTYNSSPAALEEALATLRAIRGKRKIAALGDMLELGEHSVEAHRKAGEQAAKATDMLITVGVRAGLSGLAGSAKNAGLSETAIHPFDTSKNAAAFLEKNIQPGDTILVKGSQSMRMEHIIAALMAHPEHKKDLLVRQDAEWQNR